VQKLSRKPAPQRPAPLQLIRRGPWNLSSPWEARAPWKRPWKAAARVLAPTQRACAEASPPQPTSAAEERSPERAETDRKWRCRYTERSLWRWIRRGEILGGRLHPESGRRSRGKSVGGWVDPGGSLRRRGSPQVLVVPLTTQQRRGAEALRVSVPARDRSLRQLLLMAEQPRARSHNEW